MPAIEATTGKGTWQDDLAAQIQQAMQDQRVPGVAVGVYRQGETWLQGFGSTNCTHPLPVDPDTLFQVGSTTKTLTATAIMQLVDQGRIALDTPVRQYLPELELSTGDLTEQLTLRHLLTHSAGFEGDLFEDFGRGEEALARAVARMRELPVVTPLGRVWNYSNAGFCLLGRVIEVVTGTSFEQAIQELQLAPLGLNHSFFLAEDMMTHAVAAGHVIGDEGPALRRPWQLPRAVNPAGGLVSSVRDQLAWARFQMGDGTGPDGTRQLPEESLREMQRPQIKAGGGRAAHGGLGWLIQRTPGVLAHGGSTLGQESSFVIVPSQQFAITVLTNADRGVLVHQQAVKWALRNLVTLERPQGKPERIGGAQLETLCGQYRARLQTIDVTANGELLNLQVTPTEAIGGVTLTPYATRAEAYAGGTIRCLDGNVAGHWGEFIDDAGQQPPAWLRVFGRVHAR